MDVINAFLATLWKMFAGDLPLSIGALVVVAAAGISVRSGFLPADSAPILLAVAILIVLAAAVIHSVNREIKGRTRR